MVAVGVVDMDLTDLAAGHIGDPMLDIGFSQRLEKSRQALGLKGKMLDPWCPAFRCLGDLDQMDRRPFAAVEPLTVEAEGRPRTRLKAQHLAVEMTHLGQAVGPDVDVV